jgi:hypothetical protein
VSGFETPEEAARLGTPERFARVVWIERSGDRAVVLLQMDSEESRIFDVSLCVRGPEGWECEVSGSADGSEEPSDYVHWLESGEI